MVIITDMQGTLQPGRLYLVAAKQEFPIPTPDQWKGRLELLPGFGVFGSPTVYRMELAEPWPVWDAYAYFISAAGSNIMQISGDSPVVIVDAEDERAQIDATSGAKDLVDDALRGSADAFSGLGDLARVAGVLISFLPWILGVGAIIAVVWYSSKAAK